MIRLMSKGTYSPKKVMPWIIQNRQKITTTLFNQKKAQLMYANQINCPYRLEAKTPNITLLRNRISHPAIFEIVGCLLVFRE